MNLLADILRGVVGYEDRLGRARKENAGLSDQNWHLEQRAIRAEERAEAWKAIGLLIKTDDGCAFCLGTSCEENPCGLCAALEAARNLEGES